MSATYPKTFHLCDSITTTFAIGFPFTKPEDVFAFLTVDATGEIKPLVRNQDYVIRGENIVLRGYRRDDYIVPWPYGVSLTLLRRARAEQGVAHAVTPAAFAQRVEHLTKVYQQINEQLDRVLMIGTPYPPLHLVSKLYPYEFIDSAQGTGVSVRDGAHPYWFDEAQGAGASINSADMVARGAAPYDDWPIDEAQGVGITIDSASMIPRYPAPYEHWPVDEAQGVGVTINSASMIPRYPAPYENWDVEEAQGVGVTVNSASMEFS